MIQIYAVVIVTIMEDLKHLELESSKWNRFTGTPDKHKQALQLVARTEANCKALDFTSARKQCATIRRRVEAGNCTTTEFSGLVAQLRTRIYEDMQEVVFFCVNDTGLVKGCFRQQEPSEIPAGYVPGLVFKRAHELFDCRIVERWPETTEEIEEAVRCFIFDRFTACAFHLMRVVEIGVLRLGNLAGIDDPKPSWGSVLGKVEKYALRTSYGDLPPKLQPHINTVKGVLPKMQAIQHAWRNDKIAHVADRLIPAKTITAIEAWDIMNAVNSFMRTLAEELPY